MVIVHAARDEVRAGRLARLLRDGGLSAQAEVAETRVLSAAARGEVGLVVTDAADLCRRLRAEAAAVPVLLLSGNGGADCGADAWLPEPVEPAALRAVVRVLVRAARAEAAWRDSEAQRARAAEAAAEAARARDDFLAVLSHELRTPLTSVLGWVQFLRRGPGDPETLTRALEVIERNVRQQARLIEEILDVSRLVSGKLSLDVQPHALGGILAGALESIRLAADAAGVVLDAPPAWPPVWVAGDSTRLEQVFWNLLSNAVKFTPRGGRVTVRLAGHADRARVTVSDTGPGISAALLPHIFERFRQGDPVGARRLGGVGLGLAIVRHLVEAHAGTVSAASAGEGRGTTFTVELPALVGPPAAGPESPSRVAAGSLVGVRALVVDDDADTCEMIGQVLRQQGADVRAAHSAAEALAVAGSWPANLLLTDIAMPGEDGVALLRRLQRESRPIPAVAVTALAGVEDRRRLLAAGFRAHIAKPFDGLELIAVARFVADRGAGA
jgi:signal transduction histidine kinase